MLTIKITQEIIEWLCEELNYEDDKAEEFAQMFVGILRASGGLSLSVRITYICAHCGGFAEVPFLAVGVFDSGTTLTCDKCGEHTVFDLDTPEQRAKRFGDPDLLEVCKAAHRSLALSRTVGKEAEALKARENAESLLYDALRGRGAACRQTKNTKQEGLRCLF